MEYESLGHMSIALSPDDHFIPHHPVFKGDVATSDIRVLFEASVNQPSPPLRQTDYFKTITDLEKVNIFADH